MSLVLCGLNHKIAPLEVREKFSFTESSLRNSLASLVDGSVVEEGVILSTCNRSEVYAFGPPGTNVLEKSRSLLVSRGDAKLESCPDFMYEFTEETAVQHLFEVATGLDSMILGEGQILGQVKKSFLEAQGAGFTGPVLNKLFDGAIRTGKRARSETAICQGASSISFAAVELAKRIFGDLRDCRVLLIGAGKMSELTVRLLVHAGVKLVVVANRTVEKARAIARACGGQVASFDELSLHLRDADAVISSTSAPHPILTVDKVASIMKARRGRPLFIVDIAVPRDVEPGAGAINNVYLYNVDDLQDAVNQNLVERCGEIERVKEIIHEEFSAFMAFLRSRDIIPIIKCLREGFENVAETELERICSKNSLSDKEKKMLASFSNGLVAKLLHRPTVKLKELAGATADKNAFDSIRCLFCEPVKEKE
jgi:glutamyl-tRNA reductase